MTWPDLAPGPAHRREHGLDEIGHVVGDDLEDRARPLRCPVAKADQLLPGGAVPGELAMPAGGRAQDRAGVTGAGKVRCVAAVERVEADVDRVGRECWVGVRRDVGASGVPVVVCSRVRLITHAPGSWCWRQPAWQQAALGGPIAPAQVRTRAEVLAQTPARRPWLMSR
jgi:hypothetical protein